ncbi:MAG: PIN domain-containing protein [Candidatus Symbiobacter sp.]|nr:PIN domain-containing protein [Candidatus Symbiobacter sp.]
MPNESKHSFVLGGVFSVQVYNEFSSVAHRKYGLSYKDIANILKTITEISGTPIPIDFALHQRGIAIAERYKFSFYDSLIVAAALQAECATLYSEDMQHGQVIADQMRIINPFKLK